MQAGRQPHVDIGILTVIPAELDAALRVLDLKRCPKDEDTGTIYWEGSVHSELTGHDHRVVLSCIGEAGNPSAAAAATELLQKYKPRLLLLMGIAAGIRGKVKIGDVVLSERIVGYEPAALVKAADSSDQVDPRPEMDRIPHRIMQDVVVYQQQQDESRLEAVFRRIGGEFPTPPAGKEEEYAEHVATAIRARGTTIGSGEKLLRNPDKIKTLRSLHGKLDTVEMEAGGVVAAARRMNVLWLIVRSISDFGDEFKNDAFHTFASKAAAAVLADFLIHGLDLGPPRPPPGWQAAKKASAQWEEETHDVIGRDVRIPRDDLSQSVINSVLQGRVTVLLGDSGSGKSALVKALLRSGSLPGETLCLDAQEAATLVRSDNLDTAIKVQRKGERLLVLDGVDRVAGAEDKLRLIGRILRALDLSSDGSTWRLLMTCQTALWERVKRDLNEFNFALTGAACITVGPLNTAQVEQVAKEVQDIAPVLLREALRPVLGRPKVLDLLACAAAEVGLPDTTQWVGESSLIEWAWDKFIRGGNRGDQHALLLQNIAARVADDRQSAISLAELTTSDAALIADLARLGVLVHRYDAVKFSHDLYADYARQRYLLSFFSSRRLDELKSRLANPLWQRAIRLVGLHLLEYRDTEGGPDVAGWRELVRSFDERGRPPEPAPRFVAVSETDPEEREAKPGAGVDLLLEAITFAAQPAVLLDSINEDLTADRGALLNSFLFRFRQAAIKLTPLRALFRSPEGEVASGDRSILDQIVPLPEGSLWRPIIEWMSRHAEQVISLAPDELLEAAELWLLMLHAFFPDQIFESPLSRMVAQLILRLAEHAVAAGDDYSWHNSTGQKRVRLYQLMLLCGSQNASRVRALVQASAGLVDTVPDQHHSAPRFFEPPRRYPPVAKPDFWPNGPREEPSEQFRQAALTNPGAKWLITLDARLARDVFLALLIELPDERERGPAFFQYGLHFEAGFRFTSKPFWDFAPSHELLMADPALGLDFIIQATDFATDRWAAHWPHVPHAGTIFETPQIEVPKLVLTIGGVSREYVGDARVLEWHRGGHQGPDTAAAVLMSLEHWLYQQKASDRLDEGTLKEIFVKSHSVALLGVLLDLALKDPVLLLGPLGPLLQSAELLLWSRHRTGSSHARTAMVAWMGSEQERAQAAWNWHTMEHREGDMLLVAAHLFVMRGFDWPAIDEARSLWSDLADRTNDDTLRAWIRDMLLPYFDRSNWRPTLTPDGKRGLEYVHPPAIEQRQAAARAAIELRGYVRHFPLRCRKILDGESVLNEGELVELLEFADSSFAQVSKDDTWLMGGRWTSRCGAAAVAFLKFGAWLDKNRTWQTRCRQWLVDACLSDLPSVRSHPHLGGTTWDSFCAEAVPFLWSRKQQDKELRRCIASLVGAPHEETCQRLFRELAQRRAEYPDDFGRLLHLAVWLARLVVLDTGPPPEDGSNGSGADKAFRRLAGEFVRGRLEPLSASWTAISQKRPTGLPTNPYGEYDGFGEVALMKAFAWLAEEAPGHERARDRALLRALVDGLATIVPDRLNDSYDEESERNRRPIDPELLLTPPIIIRALPTRVPEPRKAPGRLGRFASKIRGTAKDGLSAARMALGSIRKQPEDPPAASKRRKRAIGTPYGVDHDIIRTIALFLVHDRDSVSRRKLWEPWLQLGEPCHYWVEALLGEIYRAAAQSATPSSILIELLRDLLDHALADGGWLDGKRRHAHRVSEVGAAFLGARVFLPEEFWTAARAPVALALRDYWPRWADAAITWNGCATAFIRLLRAPAMALMRPACLQWLVRSDKSRWMSSDEARTALMRLLELIWEERLQPGSELTGESRGIFEGLLRELLTRQVPDAVHLSTLVARQA